MNRLLCQNYLDLAGILALCVLLFKLIIILNINSINILIINILRVNECAVFRGSPFANGRALGINTDLAIIGRRFCLKKTHIPNDV